METSSPDPTYYLRSAPVPKAIAHFAVPMMLTLVLDLAYNLIDAYFVGQLGDPALLAALTLGFPVLILIMGVSQVFGIGGGTLVPRLLGADDAEGARRASAVTFYLALAAGAALTVVLWPSLGLLITALGATGETAAATRDFLSVLLAGAPLLVLTVVLSETIRGEGASSVAMRGMLASVAVNIALDPLFLFVFHWGVAGAAAATVAGNGAAVAYFVWYLAFRSKVQSVRWADFRPTKAMLTEIFSVGSAPLLFLGFILISTFLFNSYALRYDENIVAAFGVANRITQVVEFLGQGLFAGIVPLLAYAYTSGDHGRLKAVVRTTVTAFLVVTAVVGGVLFWYRHEVFGLFSTDPGVLRAGGEVLTAMLVATLFTGLASIFSDLFQAFGAGGPANLMGAFRGVILIPFLFLFNLWFGITGVIWALPAAEIAAALLGTGLWLVTGRGILALPLERRAALDGAAS